MKAADIREGMRCHVGANFGVDKVRHRSVGHVVEVLPGGKVRVVLDSGWSGVVACGRVKPAPEIALDHGEGWLSVPHAMEVES